MLIVKAKAAWFPGVPGTGWPAMKNASWECIEYSALNSGP
jgi:hypothetical protein